MDIQEEESIFSHGIVDAVYNIADDVLERFGWDLLLDREVLDESDPNRIHLNFVVKPEVEALLKVRYPKLSLPKQPIKFNLSKALSGHVWDKFGISKKSRSTLSRDIDVDPLLESLTFAQIELGLLLTLHDNLVESETFLGKYVDELSAESGEIESIRISGFYSIQDLSIQSLGSTSEIYFVGENGEGKTLLFLAIALAFVGYRYRETDTCKEFISGLRARDENFRLTGKTVHGKTFRIENRPGLKPKKANEIRGRFSYLSNIFCYGANRVNHNRDEASELGFATIFESKSYLNSPFKVLTAARTKRKSAKIPYQDLLDFFQDLLEKKVRIIEHDDEEKFLFEEKNFKVELDQLSEGYKNALIWTADLIYRLQLIQPKVRRLQDFKAVVMVDEIDLHLHPRWQARFVKTLRRYFEKIQFIFTTHSPIMLQGAGDDAVFYRVYRNAEGFTEVSEPYYKKDMNHMMFNTLMTSPLFGMDSASMSPGILDVDTSDDYLHSRVAKRVQASIAQKRKNGKTFLSKEEIDALVDEMMAEELGR